MVVAGVITLVVVHAALALRKLPGDYRQHRSFRDHMNAMKHSDTTLWWRQLLTGFAMFFLSVDTGRWMRGMSERLEAWVNQQEATPD